MTGVDADLATLRDSLTGGHSGRTTKGLDALARVEAELSRLRMELDETGDCRMLCTPEAQAELSRLREFVESDNWLKKSDHELVVSRLREQRDAENTEKAEWYSKALAAQQDKEAAEARCARLQQALREAREELARDPFVRDGWQTNRAERIKALLPKLDEALAGPDTPAAKNDARQVEAMLRHTRPIAPDRFADTPADSQEDKT